jgi:GxxExxY protein
MNANERESLVKNVIGAVYEVSNLLGVGFLEKVYERALVTELRARGIRARTQAAFPVVYKGECVGEYFADILVEDSLLPGTEVLRGLLQGTSRPMPELSEGLRQEHCSPGQLSKA